MRFLFLIAKSPHRASVDPFPSPGRQTKQEHGPKSLTEVEIQVADVSAAIVAAANIAWPPRTIGLRILDSEGSEVFGRRKADRR